MRAELFAVATVCADWFYRPEPPYRVTFMRVDGTVVGVWGHQYIEAALDRAIWHCLPPLDGHLLGVVDAHGMMLFGYNFIHDTPHWFGVRESYRVIEDLEMIDPFRSAAWEAMSRATCEGDR